MHIAHSESLQMSSFVQAMVQSLNIFNLKGYKKTEKQQILEFKKQKLDMFVILDDYMTWLSTLMLTDFLLTNCSNS